MNEENLKVAKWELNGLKTILLMLQETNPEQSDLFFVMGKTLDSAISKLSD